MKSNHGFTLIELMVVVAIIAILASIAISVYDNAVAKAQLSEAFTIADGVRVDVSDYYTQTGACPASGQGGLSAAASYSGNYVASVNVGTSTNGCAITALMRSNTVAPRLRGKQVTLTMTSNGGALNWSCSTNADPVFVPTTCR